MARFGRNPATSWGLSRRIEENYARQLNKLTERVMERLETANNADDINRVLRTIANAPEFTAYCESLAESMVKQVYRSVNQNWRTAALEASHKRGRAIYEEIKRELKDSALGQNITDIIMENASLIKTIPDKLAKEASLMARESAFMGVRSGELRKNILSKIGDLLPYEAKRIARTETGKAQEALTQSRAKSLGVNWYIWRTAQDGQRVRASHRLMEGVLVSWDNPPSPEKLNGDKNPPAPYNAGNIYNCRCYAEPVIDISLIGFPIKVFTNGRIQTMNRASFIKIA